MQTKSFTNITSGLFCAASLAVSSSAFAQGGFLLHAGDVIDYEFDSMTLGSYPVQGRESYGYWGDLLFSTPDTICSLRVELFQWANPTPFWTWEHDIDSPGLTTSFGYAEWGAPWAQQRGGLRLTYLSGPDIELTSFSARQSLFSAGVLTAYEALVPVPEPSTTFLVGIAGLAGCAFLQRRRKMPPNEIAGANTGLPLEFCREVAGCPASPARRGSASRSVS